MSRRALIVGGSMAGLCAGLFLRQRGWGVDIYERSSEELTSRYYVVKRETLHQSPVVLTPYQSETRIDDRAIGEIVDQAYTAAGIHPDQITDLAERMATWEINPAPILLVHRGPQRGRDLVDRVAAGPPRHEYVDRADQHHRVWAITQAADVAELNSALGSQALIADGHHRYAAYLRMQQERPGGRIWTVRNGTTVELSDGTRQNASWASENYFNCGAARIPSIHKTILNYCRELGVTLEVEINSSRSSLLVNETAFGGKPIEQRQAVTDTRLCIRSARRCRSSS